MEVKKTLDTRGMACPMPIVKAKKAIEELNPGEVLEVIADDPGAREDFPAWCEQTGHILLEIKEEGDVIRVYIKHK